MARDALVSVIISNYNYARYLGEAIDSALSQTYRNVEVIVVDDGSTDDSLAVVKSYGPRIRWVQQPNQGISVARNHGIAESRGELLALLDSDDAWCPDKLERQVPFFADRDVGMVYCGLQYVDTVGRPLGTNTVGARGRVLREMALLRGPGVPASGSSAVVRRGCFSRVGGFDPALSTGADWDMWRRIACHYEIETVPEPLVRYRLHAANMHRNVAALERDKLRSFASMFADPAAAELGSIRRRCYGNLFLMLSGSYLAAGGWDRAVLYGLRAVLTWPPSVAYLLALPLRRVRRFRRAWHGQLGVKCDGPSDIG